VLLGSPAAAAEDFEGEHRINLFFNMVEPSGFGAFAPDETWLVRLLCLVDGGECAESLSFEVGSPELTAFTPHAWIAGLPGSPVTLRWESWEAGTGWTALSDHVDTEATSEVLDPAAAGSAVTVDAPMPFKDRPAQLVLYAVRNAARFPDGLPIQVRSNPVLINLYEGA
jgi:hypothetical protein